MPVPGNKLSRTRSRRRRAHIKLSVPVTGSCAHCGQPTLPHHVCSNCGYYSGRAVLTPKV